MKIFNQFLNYFKKIILYPINIYKKNTKGGGNELVYGFIFILILLMIKTIFFKSKIEIGNKYDFKDFTSKEDKFHYNKYFDSMIVLNENTVIVNIRNLKNKKVNVVNYEKLVNTLFSDENFNDEELELINKMKESDNKIKLNYKYDSENEIFEILGGSNNISPFYLDRIIGKWIWKNDEEGFYNEKNIGYCFFDINEDDSYEVEDDFKR
jgi:hypothetical protein